jgi:hypothetical protein
LSDESKRILLCTPFYKPLKPFLAKGFLFCQMTNSQYNFIESKKQVN